MSYVELKNITKRFGTNTVLENMEWSIEKGQVIAVIGPSGTGKSTLLRTINRLEEPESGTFTIDGRTYDLTTHDRKELHALRKETEMIFQSFNLFQNRTALENVMEGLVIVKNIPEEEAKKIAIEELTKVGMLDRMYYYPKHLSGGQQQRVAIARALAMRPNLLLMDEPTSALDPELVGEVLSSIKTVASEGNTILLVTHEMSFVRSVADQIIFLEGGKVVAYGTPEEVFGNPKNARLKEFLQKINLHNLSA